MSDSTAALTGRFAHHSFIWLAAAFLAANGAARGQLLQAALGDGWALTSLACGLALVAALVAGRPTWLAAALELFGASFLLYGFHAYRLSSQVFELIVVLFAVVLLARHARGGSSAAPAGRIAWLAAAYALLATLSLLLLPAAVLEHRAFVEGRDLARAVLVAFPKDPLYPIASVNRLWLLLLFTGLLSAQTDAVALYRRLFRGVAWSAAVACVLGLLDFTGAISLDAYNLSNLFYGRSYRRLQSTFGNPSWFACFVACALPFVWLAFEEAGRRLRLALAAALPLVGAGLFLSGARAAWLVAGLVVVGLIVAETALRRSGPPVAAPDRVSGLALAISLATAAALAVAAWTTPLERRAAERDGPPSRLEGLSREMQYRGVGLASPRRLAAAYALELARQKPLLGLGYETFNIHLRAQLEIPAANVARIVNTGLAADTSETVFDDSHNTYLQVLVGTGMAGLALWLALAVAGLLAALRALRLRRSRECLAVALALVAFHAYGLFQGMAYIPVTFVLYPLATGFALVLAAEAPPSSMRRRTAAWTAGLVIGGLAAASAYAADSGFASLKGRLGVVAYLPDEAAEYEGFYRPETGGAGEFRWMRERAIVNVRRPGAFRLTFSCQHPDLAREPVVLTLRFANRDAGQLVFRRTGEAVERRFDFGEPGALRLSLSRTFRPGGPDRRELGIAVSAIRWE